MEITLDSTVCPGCNIKISSDNNGCPFCGWEIDGGVSEEFPHRIPPLTYFVFENTFTLNDVSSEFIKTIFDTGRNDAS